MLLPNRHGNSSDYRYGFNGMEKDDELKGTGNSYDFTKRFHDPRVGRFFSIDPLDKQYPFQSPYIFAGANPIRYIDIKGMGPGDPPVNVNAIQNLDKAFIESLVDMAGSTKVNTNSLGWPRDPQYFWNEFKTSEIGKASLSEDNLQLIKDGKSAKVDKQWNDAMRKYDLDGKIGEGIEHHHHNKGRTAYPRPKSKHTSKAWNKVLHRMSKRFGKARQNKGYYQGLARKRGTLQKGVGKLLVFIDFVSIFADSPHSAWYTFGPGSELNRAYYNDDTNLYFEYKEISKDGNTIRVQWFEDYEMIDGEWRGIIKSGEEKTYQREEDSNDAIELKLGGVEELKDINKSKKHNLIKNLFNRIKKV
ncbi:hypothetical protein AB832_01400 [Flavobacteriaceae bacterium (ex Bugula neritina AB1)]|nr:hypothetical protein AB832_01400 [Flavobacteriaceae bacterium (ex Bugula neritina AB1)]